MKSDFINLSLVQIYDYPIGIHTLFSHLNTISSTKLGRKNSYLQNINPIYLKYIKDYDFPKKYGLIKSFYEYSHTSTVIEKRDYPSTLYITTDYNTILHRNGLNDLQYWENCTKYHKKKYVLKITCPYYISLILQQSNNFTYFICPNESKIFIKSILLKESCMSNELNSDYTSSYMNTANSFIYNSILKDKLNCIIQNNKVCTLLLSGYESDIKKFIASKTPKTMEIKWLKNELQNLLP